MNERINQLALQARLGPALLLHHWGTVDALADSEQDGLEQIEKFAELIVRECAAVAGKFVHDNKYKEGGISEFWLKDGIKEHFGIEE